MAASASRCRTSSSLFCSQSGVAMVQFLVVMLISRLAAAAMATQYTVGAGTGWGLGNDLQSWASQYKFQVGDELYFSYPSGQHSVLLVAQDDYNSCNTENPITSDNGEGDMAITLVSAQTYFFICGVSGHCEQGLRLSVVVQQEEAIAAPPPKEDDDQHDPPPAPPQEDLHGPPPAAPQADEHVPPPAHDTSDETKQGTRALSPPYYSQYNTFHRNASPQLPVNTLGACIAALLVSFACTIGLPSALHGFVCFL